MTSCGGLDDVPQSVGHLNTWSPVGDAWVDLGDVALLKDVCPLEQALQVLRLSPF